MAELKTKKTTADVDAFLAGLDEKKRADAQAVCDLMRAATGEEPAMWGPSIVGFGHQHYVYESGREGDWFEMGFSPRKQALTLYLTSGLDALKPTLDRLGKYSTGKGCLYVKRMADVDQDVLKELIEQALAQRRAKA